MSDKRTICVVTGSRAEYGLLSALLRCIRADASLQLQLVVTGMHLSPEFGSTWRAIVDDGFTIDRKVEMLLSADTPTAIAKSQGLGVIGFADALAELQPQILLVLGDRFESFAAVQAALHLRIPVAHIHGGELSEGASDDAMRHAMTKMAHLHFTATEAYRQRVIRLGEQPGRVFNVGALAMDNIRGLSLLDKAQLQQALAFTLGEYNLLVTFHPVTLEPDSAAQQFDALLTALDAFPAARVIFTHANADAGGRVIKRMIAEYCQRHADRCAEFVNLGVLRYLSLLQYVDAVVGNSSSGLLEAPAFKIATINIGDRQKGRFAPDSVLHCAPDSAAIIAALQHSRSAAFQRGLQQLQHPYGNGDTAHRIVEVLKTVDLNDVLKKRFFDG
jgi:UDP-hydrolysing UDP-N-acetyl-D-glucosamine 2-epimerase